MDHRGQLGAQLVGRGRVEPQAGLLDVAREHAQARMRLQPRCGGFVVLCAYECVDGPLVLLEEAVKDLSTHEARSAGEEHGAHN